MVVQEQVVVAEYPVHREHQVQVVYRVVVGHRVQVERVALQEVQEQAVLQLRLEGQQTILQNSRAQQVLVIQLLLFLKQMVELRLEQLRLVHLQYLKWYQHLEGFYLQE